MPQDHYQILGVARNATPDEIREARNFLAAGLHPDRFEAGSKHWHRANEKLCEINAAFAVLNDPLKRAEYDQQSEGKSQPPTPPFSPRGSNQTCHHKRALVFGFLAFAILALGLGMHFFGSPPHEYHSTSARAVAATPSLPKLPPSETSPQVTVATTNATIPKKEGLELKLLAHAFGISAVKTKSASLSSSGEKLLTCGEDNVIRISDWATGKLLISTFLGPEPEMTPWSAAFSAEDSFVGVSLQNGTVQIRETATLRLRATIGKRGAPLFSIKFNPAGRLLAGGGKHGDLQILDTASGRIVFSAGHGDIIYSVGYSPNGHQLATGASDGKVRIFKTPAGILEHTLNLSKETVSAVCFSPDGHMLAAAGHYKQIVLIDPETGKTIDTLGGDLPSLVSLAFTRDGKKLAGGGKDGRITLWDISAKPALLGVWLGHEEIVKVAGFSADGRFLITTGGKSAKVWNVAALQSSK